MRDRAIVDIHDVYEYREVEINIVPQGELEPSWRFSVFLAVGAIFGEFIKRRFVDFMP